MLSKDITNLVRAGWTKYFNELFSSAKSYRGQTDPIFAGDRVFVLLAVANEVNNWGGGSHYMRRNSANFGSKGERVLIQKCLRT